MIFKRVLSLFAAAVFLVSFAVLASPRAAALDDPPTERLKAAYVWCLDTGDGEGRELFSLGVDKEIYPASSTKIMTAIVALDELSGRLDERVTLTSDMLSDVIGNRLGLEEGEVIPIRDLIYILVTGGNNDAAYCLAHLAATSVADFVDKMNAKAFEITGSTKTHYTNPSGIHDDLMKTTGHDTFLIAKYAWENYELFRDASSAQMYPLAATNKREFVNVYNKNCFISSYYADTYDATGYFDGSYCGINAGGTNEGGQCLITVYKTEELSFLVLVMGAEWEDDVNYSYVNAKALAEWAAKSFARRQVLSRDRVVCDLPVSLAISMDHITVSPERDISVFLPTDVDIDHEVEYVWSTDEDLTAPLHAGDVVGTITAYYGGQPLDDGTCSLIVTADVERSEFLFALRRIEIFTTSRGFIAAVMFAVVASVAVVLFNARRRKVSKMNVGTVSAVRRRTKR